jgi:dephospho-CoA kinase
VLNRKLLGAKLFTEQDKSKIDLFNEITGSVIQNEIEKHFDDNVVVDWVLLPKTRFWNIKATKILVKSIDEELRYAKIIERDNVSKEYLENREKSGVVYTDNEYDYIIVNDYNMENLNKKAEEICNNLKDK